jgi:signal peptidase I
MVHDSLPLVKAKSYIKGPDYPYFRFPGFENIERNDIVVFSWPVDTLVDIIRPEKGSYLKPLDKKTNYVKRCVGLPGDSLEVRNGYVYINGAENDLPDRAKLQFGYYVKTSAGINDDILKNRYDITDRYQYSRAEGMYYFSAISDQAAEKLKNHPSVVSIDRAMAPLGTYDKGTFPNDPRYSFNTDNFGPIYIPQAGKTVAITPQSIPFYKRIIEVYEGRELGIDNKISQSGPVEWRDHHGIYL